MFGVRQFYGDFLHYSIQRVLQNVGARFLVPENKVDPVRWVDKLKHFTNSFKKKMKECCTSVVD